jgi:DNA-binding transcriptional LysR family regulator
LTNDCSQNRNSVSLLEDMTVFVRAVEAASFSGAAQRLGLAKSVVSRRIRSLEARLGTSLFHRTTRRLSLTETGQAYYERARRILADIIEAEEVARRLQSELKGTLKVAAPMSFGLLHLSPAVADFLVAHPQLEIDLDLNDRRVDLVNEGHDLAIRIGKLADSSLIARRLAPCRHVVCASPAYLQARGEPRSPEELEDDRHDCLLYRNRTISNEWRFRIGGEWRSLRVRATRLGVNNGDVLRDAAIAGIGLVVLPTFIVSEALRRGDLKAVLCDFELDDPAIHAVWPPNRELSAKVRAFVDFLSERFGGTPYWDAALPETNRALID